MNKALKAITYFSLLIFIISCNNNIEKEYWPNGNLKSEKTYKNKVLDGISTHYYENGK